MIQGKNPTLLNVTYIRPNKRNENQEYFEVIYKTEDGEVHRSNEPANADIYMVKPEYRKYHLTKPEERMEKMDKITVPVSKIKFKIAEEMGDSGKTIIQRAYSEHNFKYLNQLYKWPFVYGADFQPEYYYMKKWYENHKLENVKLSKGFLDIETDMMDYQLNLDDIPNTAYSPVNLITVILEDTKECYTFILRPYEPSKFGRSEKSYKERYELYQKQLKDHEWLMRHKNEFIDDLHKSFDEVYGYLNYNLREYEKEIDLIADVFRYINFRKPNFMLSWNMRFDIQYLLHRIIALGYDPKYIMCHPDFPEENRRCSFQVDRSTFKLEKQYDYFYCSSYTQYICQMRLYASIRKSQHMLKSVKLNDIGDRELKERKVEYPAETNMMRFPYVDWIRFIKYNIKDVLIQLGIERRTKDVMTYYKRSHSNLTPYNKIFRETHLLRNVREMYFEKAGWVQSNNLNIIDEKSDEDQIFYGSDDDEDDEVSFKGAIMADPNWNAPVGKKILGEKSNRIHENSMDYDMGAFYPSIKIASNMDPITLLYKASFDNEDFLSGEYRNRSLNKKYEEKDKNGKIRKLDFTGEAVNTYVSKNILTFGYNYLNLPSVPQLTSIVLNELKVNIPKKKAV